jgi:hypothetical protein
VANFPLAFLDYGGLLFAFLCYFFRFGRTIHVKISYLEEWTSQRVVGGMIFCPFFFFFFFFFFSLFSLILEARSTFLRRLLTDTHPPSHVPRRLPPLPLQALVVSVVGDRRVAPTCLGALCSVVRVRVTLRIFQAVLGGNRLYGIGSSSGWSR